MKKIIITEFFTTVSFSHFFTSLSFIILGFPFIRKGNSVNKVEKAFLGYLEEPEMYCSGKNKTPHSFRNKELFHCINQKQNKKNKKILSFYNGRTAIFQALKLIGIEKGDEIIVNSYNCVSVINSIIQASGTPIYIDIDKKNFSFDIKKLEEKISKKTKVIIIQHTFGKTGNIEETLKIAKKHNLVVIEDVAHSLGSIFENKKHGTFGDFAIFSTGRDKVISGVNGGFLLINNEKYFDKVDKIKNNLKDVPIKLVLKNLFYNISGYLAYKAYNFFCLGKFIIYASRKLGLINEIVEQKEKNCKNDKLNYSLPNSLAKLALNDLENIEEYNKHRRKIAKFYDKNLNSKYFEIAFKEDKNENINYFRYAIIFKKEDIATDFFKYMRKNGILLGDSWSGINIAPKGTCLKCSQYKFDCPSAEKISKNILFLPNSKFVNIKEAEKVVKLANNYNKDELGTKRNGE